MNPYLQLGTTYNTGKQTWRHNEPYDYLHGRPSQWMLGPCPQCGRSTSTYGGGFSCHDIYCPCNANNFVCSAGPMPKWWNTGVQVCKDGDAWCAVGPDFINLQESTSGFGKNPREAVAALELETAAQPKR